MSSARRAIILTVILAFLAGLSGAFVGTKLLAPKEAPDNALHAMLHSKLNLSVAQDKNIAKEEQRFALIRAQLEVDAHRANVELAKAIQTSKRDGPEVQMAIEHVHMTLGNYQKETVSHIFRMRAVLTPEQAEIFDRSVAQALMQEPQ
jgi:nickel and cobalt resistance protein CnrR